MAQQITIHDIVHRWKLNLHKIRNYFYIGIAFILVAFLISVFQAENFFSNLIFGVTSVVTLFIVFLMILEIKKLYRTWQTDFSQPTERLLQIISMISSQKLDLLPEEQSNSYASEFHIKLLEVARGILEHQRFIDRVVDNMFEMMFLLNQDGFILKVNKSACETTKFLQTELVGQHIRKLFPYSEGLVDYYLELEIQFTTQGIVKDVEVFVQTSEGELLPFSMNGVKIENSSGSLLGYTMIAKNQTEVFRLFNQLNKSNFNLGRANDELGKRYDQIKKEIEEKEGQRRVLEMELATSQLVQKTFLPQKAPVHSFVECAGTAIPAAFCGGDWWNTISTENRFYIFIADVTGHGTAGAMVTAAVSGFFVGIKNKILGGESIEPDILLQGINSVLTDMGGNDGVRYYMTCFCCVLDFQSQKIYFSNAGHNFPLMIREGKKIEPLVASGNRLGWTPDEIFEKKEIPLTGGEFILFYTDGLIENKNDKNEDYGKKRLRKFLENNSTKRSSDFLELLVQESLEFYGSEKALEDDITVVVTKIKQLK